MQRLFPAAETAPADPVELDHWLAREYAYPSRPWIRANMVASLDGASAWKSRSAGLSGRADQALLAVLRALADVILVGAETARREEYGPADAHPNLTAARLAAGLPATPPIAVISRRLELADSLLDRQAPPGSETLVITTRSAPPAGRRSLEDRGLEVIEAGEDDVDVREALRVLGARGMTAVLSEGGPRVLAQLQRHGLLDELCLSIAPRMVAGDAPRIVNGTEEKLTELRLTALLEADGFLFTRHGRHPDSPVGGLVPD
ncbi:dihydrofolate reductase family protein [Streptomyces sp. NPDC050433]|uniref:dihydrofolate reductase family protein n=1 Tax=Streptomyces sp. NPDC050433 TaxID=3365615 RepID=UPI00379F3710